MAQRTSIRVLVFGFLTCLVTAASAEESLKALLEPVINEHDGEVAVAIEHLPSGKAYEFNGDKPMPTASLIKFPVMIALYEAVDKGRLELDTTIRLTEKDKVPGSGILTANFSPGTQFALKDALRLMMVYSDNTATNLVIDQVGLPATAEVMSGLDCPNTKLHAKVFRRDTSIFPDRSREFGLGSTTANEMLKLLKQLAAGAVVSEAASAEMLKLMFDCDDRTKIPRELPSEVKVAHKTGAVSKSRTDAGLIDARSGRIAICVLTSNNEDRSWSDENAAEVLIGKIGRIAYDYFNPDGEGSHGPRVLRIGATGDLVETLQRTLNARLEPSPNLGIDGDFGPATEGGLKAFQESVSLPATGVVDAATWKALGTLISEDAPVAAPEIVNSQELPRDPARPLDSPPRVTCKAWAIGDAATGELLWGSAESERLHPASTTKIMTGYLVARLADQDPSVWDEIVTFSKRADDTIGSSARLKQGEKVSVGELMYGLLLPSGNDASVALAEHFGHRADPDVNAEAASDDKLKQFIEAMNVMAGQLEMADTHYDNTHGMTEDTHLTTARDLLKLVHAAMQLEGFRARVNTRQRGCTVSSDSGYTRNVIWNNTNRLLGIEGYDGVKTGTTNAAGCCLVSRGNRGDKPLFVVVLGADTSDARYVDSENLFQWSWRRLEE